MKLDMPIIVEGKYDKIKLSNIVDTPIIQTDGFRIFKNKEKCALIRRMAEQSGIIVLTDSDSAGNIIRNHIKNITGNGRIINVILPPIFGKEKRKETLSAEGVLGVEGTPDEIIISALKRYASAENSQNQPVLKSDLYSLGLSGTEGSKEKFKSVCEYLSLPKNISANSFLQVVSLLYGKEKFLKEVEKWRQDSSKN